MKEIWKDIKDFEGLFQVSSQGRLKSLERIVPCNSGTRLKKEKILTPRLDRYGYPCIFLARGIFRKNLKVHRLVAIAFIDNPDQLPEVNHKNLSKIDNRVDNLEWIDNRSNMAHYHSSSKFREVFGAYRNESNPNSKLKQFDIDLIRKLHSEYKIKQTTLSALFSVGTSQINKIVLRQQWNKETI